MLHNEFGYERSLQDENTCYCIASNAIWNTVKGLNPRLQLRTLDSIIDIREYCTPIPT